MALNYKYARMTAFLQIVLGFLCLVFGIADRARASRSEEFGYFSFPAYGGVPIWTGLWFLITGFIGFGASSRNSAPRPGLIATYLGFSITSTVFAAVIIICYAMSINILTDGGNCRDRIRQRWNMVYPTGRTRYIAFYKRDCQILVGLGSMLVLFAVVEFGCSIWAAICCCSGLENCCPCCYPTSMPAQGQVVYLNTVGGPSTGYVVTQGPGGAPIAIPANQMAGGPMTVPVQAGQMQMGRPVIPVQGGQMQAYQVAGSPGQTVYMAQAGANVQMAQQPSQPIVAHGLPPSSLPQQV